MTRKQAETLIKKPFATMIINSIEYLTKTPEEGIVLHFNKISEVMEADEESIQADTPEDLRDAIIKANCRHYGEGLSYCNKCIYFE